MSFLAPSTVGPGAHDGAPPARRSHRSLAGPRGSDRGDTLLEVLLALLVISLTSVALMSGYATSIAGSATHQSLAGLDVALRDAAEQVTYQVQSQANPDYTRCASASGLVTYSSTSPSGLTGSLTYGTYQLDLSGFALTGGESLSLSRPEYWDSSKGTWVASCPADNPDGAQLLTLSAYGRHGVGESVQIVVIDLAGSSS